MEIRTLRAQTVLYHNEKGGLVKSLESLYNAVRVSKSCGGCVQFIEVCYGDASESPLFTSEDIDKLNARFGEYLRLTYQFFGFNSGTSKGQNVMFKTCKADYLMAYNPDVVVCPDYFVEMMKPFDRIENVGMVEAKQLPLEHPKEFDLAKGGEPWGAMACVIIPAEIYRELGGLDEQSFFLYCDDVDFSWRLRLNGYKVIYCSRAFVYHAKYLNGSGNVVPTNAEIYYTLEAALLMSHKWSDNKRLLKLRLSFLKNGKIPRKALKEFNRRKKQGLLAEPLDKEHKISSFYGFGYSRNRY